MKGAWSIKAVLPTIAPDLDYASIEEVQDGTAAQMAYLEVIDPQADEIRKQELSRQMREYCKLDTLAVVRLVKPGRVGTGIIVPTISSFAELIHIIMKTPPTPVFRINT